MRYQRRHLKIRRSLAPTAAVLSCCLYFMFAISCDKPPEHIISENNFDSLQLAPYVEADFPFITTSIDLRNMGHGLPEWNLTSRGIVMRLADSAYACFDTDLLRWSAAWTGDFISLTGMAQISYNDFFNKKNQFPTVLGDPKTATGLYAGWRIAEAAYDDPRVKRPPYDKDPWGPIPTSIGRWEGIQLEGENSVALHYSLAGTPVVERPGAISFGDQAVFSRALEIQEHDQPFFLNVAEVTNGVETETDGNIAYIVQGNDRDSVTAVGFTGSPVEWHIPDNRYLTVSFQSSDQTTRTVLLIWKGPLTQLESFRSLMSEQSEGMTSFETKENVTRWPEKVYTSEIKSPDTAAYVTDQLLLPIPNPWQRNVRIMDVDFFDDGRGAVVSYDGDVWLVDGIGKDYMTWSRYASGLNQPMSIVVHEGEIFVFDRLGIIRFHDNNGDGEADYYENFSNIADQSMESREWPADLVVDPEGGFYLAKGGALVSGPHIGAPTHKGFVRGSQYDGSVLHISEDGRNLEVIATGLRGPYLGIHPETGFLTVTDQQGNSVPSTPVYHVQKGDYYGAPSTAHMVDTPAITPPMLWAPHNIEPSSIGEVWMTTDKMGPINGQLIHISFGRPGLFKILIDTVGQVLQGGIIYIPAYYPTPVSKGSIRKKDGYPYFAGFNLWGSSSKGISSLLRLRYTGLPDVLPTGFEAGEQGIVLRFDELLDVQKTANIGNFQVKRYNYKRTENYGSGHFRLDGSPGEEHIPVLATHLSDDQKSVLLVIPNMVEVEQVEVTYDIATAESLEISGTFAFTLHKVGSLNLEKYGFPSVDTKELASHAAHVNEATAGTEEASVELGEQLFTKMACIGCHSTGTRTDGLYGPPFQDFYGSVRQFNDSTEQVADDAYIYESILDPAAKVVKGYEAEMPSFVGILSDTEIESIILYIKSLSSHTPI